MGNQRVFFIAVILGLAAVFLFQKYSKNIKSTSQVQVKQAQEKAYLDGYNTAKKKFEEIKKDEPTELAVVAKENIQADTILKTNIIEAKQVLKNQLPPNKDDYFTDVKDLTGKNQKMAYSPILAGEVIRAERLKPPAEQKRFSSSIEKGMRAVTIDIDQNSAIAGFLEQGDVVDLVAYLPRNFSKTIKTESLTRIVLQKLKVLALGNEYAIEQDKIEIETKSKPPKKTGKKEEDDKFFTIKGKYRKQATLLVSPRQAEMLTLVQKKGNFALILRSPVDDEMYISEGVIPEEILKPEEVEIHKIEEIKYDYEETPEQIAQLQKQQDELSALRRELLEMKNRPLATDGTEKTALKEVIEFRGNRRFLNRNVLVDN